jgi:hypothetical protein
MPSNLKKTASVIGRWLPMVGWVCLMVILGITGLLTADKTPLLIAACMALLPMYLLLNRLRKDFSWRSTWKFALASVLLLVLLSELGKTIEPAAGRPIRNEWSLVAWVALGLVGTAGFILALWRIPQWQVDQALSANTLASPGTLASPVAAENQQADVGISAVGLKERADLVNEYRRTLAQIIGGFGLVVGLYFTWRQSAITERQLTITADQLKISIEQNQIANGQLALARETQVADRFTKAIEQLSAVDGQLRPKLEVRLGSIYALEQIAEQSERYHNSVLDVLTAYIRARPARKGTASPIDQDIQVALTVIGRRSLQNVVSEHTLNFEGADLRKADLRKGNFKGANLSNVNLSEADLSGSDFRGADFEDAEMAFVKFCNCGELLGKLAWHEHVDALRTDLRGAHFYGAKHLDLHGALVDDTTTDIDR